MANPKIQLRHDTAANWTTKNPILAEGEVGVETDTYKIKVGDGVKNYNDLPYATGGGESLVYTAGKGINITEAIPEGENIPVTFGYIENYTYTPVTEPSNLPSSWDMSMMPYIVWKQDGFKDLVSKGWTMSFRIPLDDMGNNGTTNVYISNNPNTPPTSLLITVSNYGSDINANIYNGSSQVIKTITTSTIASRNFITVNMSSPANSKEVSFELLEIDATFYKGEIPTLTDDATYFIFSVEGAGTQMGMGIFFDSGNYSYYEFNYDGGSEVKPIISAVPDGSTIDFTKDGKLELVLDGTGPLASQLNNMVTISTNQLVSGTKTFSGAYSQNRTYPVIVGSYKIDAVDKVFQGFAGIASNINVSYKYLGNLISCWYDYNTETFDKGAFSTGFIFTPAVPPPNSIQDRQAPASSLVPKTTYIGGDTLYRTIYTKTGTLHKPSLYKIYDESDKATITNLSFPDTNRAIVLNEPGTADNPLVYNYPIILYVTQAIVTGTSPGDSRIFIRKSDGTYDGTPLMFLAAPARVSVFIPIPANTGFYLENIELGKVYPAIGG